MPASTTNGEVKDFLVDYSDIRISLDAATPEERRVVEEAIRSKEDFLARISDPDRVFRLRPTAPYYALKVTPHLRLIYTREDDQIAVRILTNQGLIDWFASLPDGEDEPATRRRSRSGRSRSRTTRERAE